MGLDRRPGGRPPESPQRLSQWRAGEWAAPRTGGRGSASASCAPRSLRGWAARRRAGAAVARETEQGEWAARSRAGLLPD